ncbi:bifunctional biotin--[acetyl-CoA-carboxylase] ligase/biotin operon repressor BirA [Seminibacterium arietis]|uniref:biotin--[biotin carboxyl-carrier protein] ligase n=1 Tax=Seminibacterium arietis TaxID=1173502 RepID=A0ABW3I9H4_9PAST
MENLLNILADCKPHSMPNLTALLTKTPQQIEQSIIALQKLGLNIKVDTIGVHLQPQLDLLDFQRISTALSTKHIFIKSVVDSTNAFLFRNLNQLKKGDFCIAEYQTAGRGRRGRQWFSPFAGQIMLSVYWNFAPNILINGLSSVVGIAIAEALNHVTNNKVRLKWPNDLLLDGRKLGGILIELAHQHNGLLNVIIGFGINLSIGSKQQIDQPWAELIEVLPQLDRNQLIIEIMNNLYQTLPLFEQNGFSFFRQKWIELDAFLEQPIKVISEKSEIQGISQGVDNNGFLLVSTKNGLLSFNAGEVSLRKQ